MTEVYYNGDSRPLLHDGGHHLHDVQMRHAYRSPRFDYLAAIPNDFPVADERTLDGGYAPKLAKTGGHLSDQPEGEAALHHVRGWTILAFWDRSGDSRGNSNSAFVIRGELDFDEAVAASRQAFPGIWARFTFAVTLREDRRSA